MHRLLAIGNRTASLCVRACVRVQPEKRGSGDPQFQLTVGDSVCVADWVGGAWPTSAVFLPIGSLSLQYFIASLVPRHGFRRLCNVFRCSCKKQPRQQCTFLHVRVAQLLLIDVAFRSLLPRDKMRQDCEAYSSSSIFLHILPLPLLLRSFTHAVS